MQSRFEQILKSAISVTYIFSNNMGTSTLPDMYALSPRASGIQIKQSTHAHVITIT